MPILTQNTKHYQLTCELRKRIAELKSDDQLPTFRVLQEAYDVSEPTLRQSLLQLRNEGLIYRPQGKQRLRVSPDAAQVTHRIAFLRPDYPAPAILAVLKILDLLGKEKNWRFDVITYSSLKNLELNLVIPDICSGAILFPTAEVFPEKLLNDLGESHLPIVTMVSHLKNKSALSVASNDFLAGKLAAEHFIELGHKRILFFNSEPCESTIKARKQGWCEALKENGLPIDEALIKDARTDNYESSLLNGYESFSQFLSDNPPNFSAVFCTSFECGMAVMRALREAGRKIPEDVNVIAWSGELEHHPDFMNPPLSAIHVDMKKFMKCIIDLLEASIEHEPIEKTNTVIEPKLVTRKTTSLFKVK